MGAVTSHASPAVLLAMGRWLSDTYAEGTIGRRFYAACQNVDTVEALAAEYARDLLGAQHAYVQPHSGIDANLVAVGARPTRGPGVPRSGVVPVHQRAEPLTLSGRATCSGRT